MSSLPPKPSLDLSQTSVPRSSTTTTPSLLSRISTTPTSSTLPSLIHSLPAKPAAALSPPRSSSYPSRPDNPRDHDRGKTDSYIAARSPSPQPFRRARSPRRQDWDRGASYIARSPSPPRPQRYSSSRSSISPVKRASPPPKAFYTRSHQRAEEFESDRTSTKAGSDPSASHKRAPSPLLNLEPPSKVAKSIPTGPRSAVPTGPRSSLPPRAIPTGPKAYTGVAAYSTAVQYAEKPSANDEHIDRNEDLFTALRSPSSSRSASPPDAWTRDMARGRGSSATRRPGRPTKQAGFSPRTILDGPLRDKQWVMAQFGQGLDIKPLWLEAPKSPVGNHLGKPLKCQIVSGHVDRLEVFRATAELPAEYNILAQGDGPSKKDAENVATISALLQLVRSGRMSSTGTGKPSKSTSSAAKSVTLRDGTAIDYERARQFMEYYCKRYRFGKPDIEFSHTETKGRKSKATSVTWDAVIAVGGRKIGMGSAPSKKNAQIQCYLDVTQYLESCDPGLWQDFMESAKKDSNAVTGKAPHLFFQMSDTLNDDIHGLCGDIKNSTLHRNAPPTGATTETQAMPTFGHSRGGNLTPEQIQAKSIMLQDRLAAYQSDPSLEKMRADRDSLPVKTKALDILAKIEVNDVTIIMAATGSGKTTQVPQMLFDDFINRGDGAKCNVLCTQPRRLAAMSVAERIADERGQKLGGEVGYQVRFDTQLPQPDGSITFCTTGIFLKRMQSSLGVNANPQSVAQMDQVSHIVVDEVHERDIDTDLSLVVLKQLLAERKARGIPLKVILMSATIDPTLFQNYFLDERGRPAPVAEVPGRTFPVTKRYLNEIVPVVRQQMEPREQWVFSDKFVDAYLRREMDPNPAVFGPDTGMDLAIPYPLVALTIAHVLRNSEDGHVLVFMPGWDEIKKVADILLNNAGKTPLGINFGDNTRYSIHYLHSTIPAAEQREVFKPPPRGVRRIILATNIAETSITIPDVVYVVDTGRVKEKRYDPDRHMSSLVSAWVGSSNLNQRAGRAGRHREGEYWGLVSDQRYRALNPHQTVEMKRSDLSNVVMHVKALNLGEVETVLAATIEPPEPSRIVAAMDVLRMLGAMDEYKNLTSLGRVLLQIPVEAAIGKLCLFGAFFRCLDSALTLAAVLTNRDPFLAPLAMREQAKAVKDSWSPLAFRSDPLAVVAAYNTWAQLDESAGWRAASDFCSENFLSRPTLQQIRQVKTSLLQSLDQTGVIAVSAGGTVGRIRRHIPPQLNENGQSLPLLAALIAMAGAPNFAIRTSEKACRTSQDKIVFIHTASVNARRREQGGPEEASASFNPAERRLYAFGEKSRSVPPGGNPSSAMTQLRDVTRLDPMTYMLFGAYRLEVTQSGLECDSWLPVAGNLHALDDIQRLKTLLDSCMLRVFEGVSRSLVKGRDDRWVKNRNSVQVSAGTSRIQAPQDEEDDDNKDDAEEGENESDEEDGAVAKRVVNPLSLDEVKELELLTSDVVRVLDAYATEREGGSTRTSRPPSPPHATGGPRRPTSPSMQFARPRKRNY